MPKELVIVESPAKARTVEKMLGDRYIIKASRGHVRDLPKHGLGVDVENGFTPQYVIPKEKKRAVQELREAARKASAVYLATDPDREGEAISWHLVEAAELKGMPVHRVVFHEITKGAIEDAFHHPRQIDMKLVEAQQARRILDRLVGYKISPLLWRKVKGGLSAGRVQSVALRMIVEREREIERFVPVEYWDIQAELAKLTEGVPSFKAKLIGFTDGRKLEISSEQQAKEITDKLATAAYHAAKISKKRVSRQPAPPFITSTLQQEAWRKLHFTVKRTMSLAQQLYEGLSIGEEGTVGLITYMRTDSTRVADTAIRETRAYIDKKYGSEFLPPSPRRFAKKIKLAQEAHEAIRPTNIVREPDSIKPYLTPEQGRLYELIWKRMVSSQMAAALFDTTTVDIDAKNKDGYLLRASSSVPKFAGFLILYSEGKDEAESEEGKAPLPGLVKNEELQLLGLFPQQHFTQPPPRYNEATLIKTLEEKGIGRPSTYAPIISTLQQRGYVERKEGRLYPQEFGPVVNDLLVEHFPNIVDIGFTAKMEERLDEIARGKLGWATVVQDFYIPFEQMLQRANTQITRVKVAKVAAEPTDEVCPKCGRPMVIRAGRYGKFLACSGFPKCKTTKPLVIKENIR